MEVDGQAVTFLTAVVTGMALGLIFDFYRMTRRVFRWRRVGWTHFFDFVYWLAALAVTFLALLASNWGELRFYVLLALGGGAAMYFRFLSRAVLFFSIRALRAAAAVARRLRRLAAALIVRPLGYCLGVFFTPFAWTGRRIKRAGAAGWRRCRPKKPPPE